MRGGASDRTALLGSGRQVASYGAHENTACVTEETPVQRSTQPERQQEQQLAVQRTAERQQERQMEAAKKTLLMRAGAGGSSQPQLKVEDIFRKGIDIARDFNASEFSGQQKVIQLVVRDKPDGSCAFPDVRVVQGPQASIGHEDVVIDMPDDADSWRQRQRNLSNSSRAPLIADV